MTFPFSSAISKTVFSRLTMQASSGSSSSIPIAYRPRFASFSICR